MRSYIGNDIQSKIEELFRSIDSMHMHGVTSITLTPARHFPATTSDSGRSLPEFCTSDLIITDDEGKTFKITVFHGEKGAPMTVTVPPQDAVRDADIVAEVVGTMAQVSVTA